MWTTKFVAGRGHEFAICAHQHSGSVDGDVPLRVAEDREDRCGVGTDGALYFDPFASYVANAALLPIGWRGFSRSVGAFIGFGRRGGAMRGQAGCCRPRAERFE
jgi:hypothetical protein